MTGPFAIRTITNTDVYIVPGAIEAIAASDFGCAVYMASGAVWHTSETMDLLTERLNKWAGIGQ